MRELLLVFLLGAIGCGSNEGNRAKELANEGGAGADGAACPYGVADAAIDQVICEERGALGDGCDGAFVEHCTALKAAGAGVVCKQLESDPGPDHSSICSFVCAPQTEAICKELGGECRPSELLGTDTLYCLLP